MNKKNIGYTPRSLSIVINENQQFYIDYSKKDSAFSSKECYHQVEIDLKDEAAGCIQCVNTDHLEAVNIVSIVLTSENELSSSNEKEKELMEKAHIDCFMNQ